METITRTRKLELYQGTDPMGRHFVAGKCGSGKSMFLKGIAVANWYSYFGEESCLLFDFPITCQQLLDSLKTEKDVRGIILDFPRVAEKLTDFQDYKWDIPVWYSIQLNRDGNIKSEDIIKYKLIWEN